MGRLTFLAACIGGMPVLTFLVVVWLTGGAPLAPLGQASAAGPNTQGAAVADPPVLALDLPSAATAAKISLVPKLPAGVAANGSIVAPEPVTFDIAR